MLTCRGIVYIYQAQSQGTLADTPLDGTQINNIVPTLIHPNETMDGAIVSADFVYACFKNPTYLHLNNPVIRDLYAEHGKTLNFAGIVFIVGTIYTQAENSAPRNYAAKGWRGCWMRTGWCLRAKVAATRRST